MTIREKIIKQAIEILEKSTQGAKKRAVPDAWRVRNRRDIGAGPCSDGFLGVH